MTDSPTGATQIVAVTPPARPSFREWLPVISTLIVLAGLLLTGGGLLQTVKDTAAKTERIERDLQTARENTRRIELLEGGDKSAEILQRLARIEARLEVRP